MNDYENKLSVQESLLDVSKIKTCIKDRSKLY